MRKKHENVDHVRFVGRFSPFVAISRDLWCKTFAASTIYFLNESPLLAKYVKKSLLFAHSELRSFTYWSNFLNRDDTFHHSEVVQRTRVGRERDLSAMIRALNILIYQKSWSFPKLPFEQNSSLWNTRSWCLTSFRTRWISLTRRSNSRGNTKTFIEKCRWSHRIKYLAYGSYQSPN